MPFVAVELHSGCVGRKTPLQRPAWQQIASIPRDGEGKLLLYVLLSEIPVTHTFATSDNESRNLRLVFLEALEQKITTPKRSWCSLPNVSDFYVAEELTKLEADWFLRSCETPGAGKWAHYKLDAMPNPNPN